MCSIYCTRRAYACQDLRTKPANQPIRDLQARDYRAWSKARCATGMRTDATKQRGQKPPIHVLLCAETFDWAHAHTTRPRSADHQLGYLRSFQRSFRALRANLHSTGQRAGITIRDSSEAMPRWPLGSHQGRNPPRSCGSSRVGRIDKSVWFP